MFYLSYLINYKKWWTPIFKSGQSQCFWVPTVIQFLFKQIWQAGNEEGNYRNDCGPFSCPAHCHQGVFQGEIQSCSTTVFSAGSLSSALNLRRCSVTVSLLELNDHSTARGFLLEVAKRTVIRPVRNPPGFVKTSRSRP